MARRELLHRLIDELREEDLPAVTRVLQGSAVHSSLLLDLNDELHEKRLRLEPLDLCLGHRHDKFGRLCTR